MTSTDWHQQRDINKETSTKWHQQSEIFRVISIKWNQLINLDRVTSTKWHSQWTWKEWHEQIDINRVISTDVLFDHDSCSLQTVKDMTLPPSLVAKGCQLQLSELVAPQWLLLSVKLSAVFCIAYPHPPLIRKNQKLAYPLPPSSEIRFWCIHLFKDTLLKKRYAYENYLHIWNVRKK